MKLQLSISSGERQFSLGTIWRKETSVYMCASFSGRGKAPNFINLATGDRLSDEGNTEGLVFVAEGIDINYA